MCFLCFYLYILTFCLIFSCCLSVTFVQCLIWWLCCYICYFPDFVWESVIPRPNDKYCLDPNYTMCTNWLNYHHLLSGYQKAVGIVTPVDSTPGRYCAYLSGSRVSKFGRHASVAPGEVKAIDISSYTQWLQDGSRRPADENAEPALRMGCDHCAYRRLDSLSGAIAGGANWCGCLAPQQLLLLLQLLGLDTRVGCTLASIKYRLIELYCILRRVLVPTPTRGVGLLRISLATGKLHTTCVGSYVRPFLYTEWCWWLCFCEQQVTKGPVMLATMTSQLCHSRGVTVLLWARDKICS